MGEAERGSPFRSRVIYAVANWARIDVEGEAKRALGIFSWVQLTRGREQCVGGGRLRRGVSKINTAMSQSSEVAFGGVIWDPPRVEEAGEGSGANRSLRPLRVWKKGVAEGEGTS